MSSGKKPQPVAWRSSKTEGGSYSLWASETDARNWGLTVEPLYSEATIEALRAERDELRLAIAGVDPTYFNTDSLRQGQYVEMAAETEKGRQYALDRAETAEARVVQLEAGLEQIAETPNAGWMIARALLSDGGRS